MSLNPDDFCRLDFQLRTKARSLDFGRRLYYLDDARTGSPVWLKTQLSNSAHGAVHAETGLRHELDFYQIHVSTTSTFLLPHQIIRQPFCIGHEAFDQALILPDAPAYFDLRPDQLSIPGIRQHLLSALEAVISLHEFGYLHADLKREHFVCYQDRVCLIDFEQVQPLYLAIDSPLNATPRYMAPELFQGQAKSIQTEVYALGIIFYEWLSAKRLQATGYQDWALLHCQRLQPELPAQYQEFQGLLQAMLHKYPEYRLADFGTVKHRLITEIT